MVTKINESTFVVYACCSVAEDVGGFFSLCLIKTNSGCQEKLFCCIFHLNVMLQKHPSNQLVNVVNKLGHS